MLPKEIYSTAQVRELDRIAIEGQGIPGYELMQRAGAVTFKSLLASWPDVQTIRIVCGLGNNGGDGYVIARLAIKAGLEVELATVGDTKKTMGDALKARQDWMACADHQPLSRPPDVIVDAIFVMGQGL